MQYQYPSAADLQTRRVFCVGKNYAEHVREMGGPATGGRCVIFMKPPSSLVAAGQTVHLPHGQGSVHHEVELLIAIGRGGHEIARGEALAHVGAVGLGVDLTLRDLQSQMKERGLPWEVSKAFEQSGLVGALRPYTSDLNLADLDLRLSINGEPRQEGNTRDMIFPVDQIISILSETWQLRPGDLIFTGTPSGVGPVESGDTLTVHSEALEEATWSFA